MAEGIKIEVQETVGSKTVEEAQKPVEIQKPKEEPKYVRLEDLDKINQAINNTREYNNRQLAELKEAIAKMTPKPVEPKPDDLDELVQKNWQLGVEKVSERVVERMLNKQVAITEEQRVAQLLEESKKKVMSKHPELSDPENPKTKEFLKVLDENPDYRTNPRGPILAAYEMENRLNSRGNIESGEKKVKEARAKAASIPQGTSPGSKGGYTLTRQDMDFCRLNNINPENYKRFKGQKEAQA